MKQKTKNGRKFNVVLQPDEYDALSRMADEDKCSMGQVVRMLILKAHGHRFNGLYVCASGQACFVPQMHQMNRPK